VIDKGKKIMAIKWITSLDNSVNCYILRLQKGGNMARRCDICGKGPQFGAQISHSHRVTKRVRYPNLHVIKIKENGRTKKIKVCSKCLKKLDKGLIKV